MQFFASLVVVALAFTGVTTASPAGNTIKTINKPNKPVISKPEVKNNNFEISCGNGQTGFCCVTDLSSVAGDKNKKNGGSKGKETTTCSKSVTGCGGTYICCNNFNFGTGNIEQSCSPGVKFLTQDSDVNLKDAIFMGLKQI
ncbi:hypothetical protein PspLS_07627 [Pyricularia sp. CBS 133598]|nr:hypothetical protein PspLS_07627 [Pyricularia sp. CBS 133598]